MKKIDSPFNGIFNNKLEQKDKLKAEKEKAREEERQLRIQKTIEKEKHEKRKEEKRKFLADLKDIILNAVSKFKVNFPDIQKIKGDVSINNFPDLKEKFDTLINSVKGIKLEEKAQKDYSLSLDKILAEIKKENPDLKIIATLLESFKKIPLLDKFRFDELGRLKVNVDKTGGGGGGSSSELVKNSAGQYINPSTEEIQEEISTKIDTLATEEKQNTQIINEGTIISLIETLQELSSRLAFLQGLRGVSADLRVTPLSLPTLSTVTTVATLTNQTNIGGFSASTMVGATQNNIAIQSNINNVTA